jgi:hypothetical protein
MAKLACQQCKTPRVKDAVICWACGARHLPDEATYRPVAFQLEAMHHYSSRRAALVSHRLWSDGLALLLVLLLAAGIVFLVDVVPPITAETVPMLAARVMSLGAK